MDPSTVIHDHPEVRSYDDRLSEDWDWAMSEGDRFFSEKSQAFLALRKLVKRLDEVGVDYSVVGGLALFAHGYQRFTDDVDLVVTKESLAAIHTALDGLGYIKPFDASKHLRDTELGVRIEFLTTGGFPGDGKEKPVAFPDPIDVSIDRQGIKFINLPTLVDLKLASGMSNVSRMKDLADILELIKAAKLPRDLAAQLNPYVRDEYDRLWQASQIKSPNDHD
ncbi:hypothetical protein Pla175_49080 [Pirellulimonas nuda]|uniref:LicD family protein n=1 Tax=Pirellulimonas nuda TaxID=2528009 RepID=A0A518DJ19_9BACT|nr:nucleotidyltransferase [Pirellulimonas nuda]QDU91479.1 hypothetical protein Pla175_49080 [Pirellulimonas nuda]